MNNLIRIFLLLLAFVTTTVMAVPAHHTPKQRVQQSKKLPVKNVEKKAKDKKVASKKTVQKKSTLKSEKNTVKKQTIANKKSTKSQGQKTAQKEIKKSNKNNKTQQSVVEKDTKNEVSKSMPLSQAKKNVIAPKCQDSQVMKVLSDAFKQQGKATGTPMTVKQTSQTRETQYYPQQGIRSCYALVETNGKKYQTNYSVILNENGFFVQVENAQAMF
ncbi:hypothetical protein BKK54_09880 [Rodentibacter genomosp. 1]|uniref:Uncharacterized protein n=1 Tax=Rodentibacter genomosp. 1 TaxID=1908264 RepID=A0A1V3J1S9_9PAST|nr:hypothetical protein [Rodentibacter genomosp. 1]OOF48994.1 hypothetical protein BKK54_09880 [Rodentibacter genomosp. 1]